jgi:phosphoesterase RecJ-like protein
MSVASTSSPALPLPSTGCSKPGDAEFAQQINALIGKSSRIAITGHERPDGDCIGSEVALCMILRHAGHNAQIVNSDPAPLKYQFLTADSQAGKDAGAPEIRIFAENEPLGADLIFVLDATNPDRLGRIKKEHFGTAAVVNIDHHLGNPNFGVVNWVDSKAAATGELIWRLAAQCNWAVPQISLQALYTALITDTGQFSYSNTNPRILRMAAEMLERGVDPEAIWQKIYLNKSAAELELEARARASMKCYAGGRICSITLTQADFAATKTGPQNTEELSGVPRSLAGVELSLFFYEVNGGTKTKVSMRSTKNIDCSALARKFGGGGHRQAAGCTLDGNAAEVAAKFLPEAEAALVS